MNKTETFEQEEIKKNKTSSTKKNNKTSKQFLDGDENADERLHGARSLTSLVCQYASYGYSLRDLYLTGYISQKIKKFQNTESMSKILKKCQKYCDFFNIFDRNWF